MISEESKRTKVCPKCTTEQPKTNFSKSADRKDGLNPYCKQCDRNKYLKNKEKVLQRSKEWARENHGRRLEIQKKWRETNKDLSNQLIRDWQSRNREKMVAACSRRRALIAGVGGNYTANRIKELIKLQKNKCACCKQHLMKYHVDHIQPISKGGSNSIENIQILCPRCNQTKSNRDPIEFMNMNGYLI